MKDLYSWQNKFEICVYAKKLLNKIAYLNSRMQILQMSVDIREVKKAIYYARKYHGSQTRQSGEPYYSHSIEVAYMLVEYIGTYILKYARTDILVIALLHDTIEDTELTEEVISCIFSDKVANQVQALTRIKPEGKISSAEMIERLYREKNYDALLVKLFDRLHNMQTIGAKSPEKIMKTLAETLKRFITLSIYLDNRICRELKTEEIIAGLCYQNLPKQYTLQDQELEFSDSYQHFFLIVQNDIIHSYIQHILES